MDWIGLAGLVLAAVGIVVSRARPRVARDRIDWTASLEAPTSADEAAIDALGLEKQSRPWFPLHVVVLRLHWLGPGDLRPDDFRGGEVSAQLSGFDGDGRGPRGLLQQLEPGDGVQRLEVEVDHLMIRVRPMVLTADETYVARLLFGGPLRAEAASPVRLANVRVRTPLRRRLGSAFSRPRGLAGRATLR